MLEKDQKQQAIDHRLADNLSDFAKRYEFPHVVHPSGLQAQLGIHGDDNKLLSAHYQFDPSGDSYWVGTAERRINENERSHIEHKMMSSPPIPGITERIVDDRLVAMSMRDGLKNQTNIEIQRGFQDDVARFAAHYNQTRQILDE
jgi:hypothetical protein